MTLGFVLLSQMDAATPTWQQSVYLFVLGAGIGLCMQVLMLVVQNTSSFADLGVATSGVTFFRTIGSSFGAAIFGSLFANFLVSRIGPALAASGAPPAPRSRRRRCTRCSPEMAAPIVDAYADSLGTVFLCAVPVAIVGFVVSLFLKEVPLREIETVSASDLGEGFGMPSTESPEKILEVAIGRMFRDSPEIRLRSLAEHPGCELDVTQLWALLQIYRQNQVFGSVTTDRYRRTSAGALRGHRADLRRSGRQAVYALRTGDRLWLTQSGARQVDAHIRAHRRPHRRQVGARHRSFEGRPGPRAGRGRARAHRASDAGAAGLDGRTATNWPPRAETAKLERVPILRLRAYDAAMSRIGPFADDDAAAWVVKSPDIGVAMAGFTNAVYNKNRLPMRVRELARMVIALDNECVVCQNTRDSEGIAAGVDEDLYDNAARVADVARLQRAGADRRRVRRALRERPHRAARRRGLLGARAASNSTTNC